MSLTQSSSNPGLAPLLAAKGYVPLLPCPHVPRPRLVAALVAAVCAHRLVSLTAGPLTGKTTLLAELADTGSLGRVFWYSVDEVDDSPRVLLEGLARTVGSAAVPVDETHTLGQIIGALDAEAETVVLILDDVHRSPAARPVIERILRYLPAHAHLVLGGHPEHDPPSALYRWLEDRGQVARLTGVDLRLDDEERASFRARTRLDGGAWAVGYRQGGQRAIVDELRAGVLPALDPSVRLIIDLLCVLPVATVAVLAAALSLPETEVVRLIVGLRDETILLEQPDIAHYRLSEAARQAALTTLAEATLGALRRDAAAALETRDPALAAHLFAQVGDEERAVATARRVSWWEWQRRQSLGIAVANLLPPSTLCHSGALALIAARLRLVERGPQAVHALVRAIHPEADLDQIERLRLLVLCYASRGRPWGLSRCIGHLDALVATRDPRLTSLERSYALVVLGTARSFAGDDRMAADALRVGLDLLTLADGDESQIAHVRLLARRTLAVVHRRLGHLAEAERLYTDACEQAMGDGLPYVQVELANNRAVLLQQRGEHACSADVLREALASPWSAERGLSALLNASLADALDALGDRAAAARALRIALADVQERDVYGLEGHVHATLALLLAEGGHADAALAEIAAGAPAEHPVTCLGRAVLLDPSSAATRTALERAVDAAGDDAPLRARARAHLARVCALGGDRRRARALADTVVNDHSYPLTPREAAILGPRTRRIRQGRGNTLVAPKPAPITLRFFGLPALYVEGRPLGTAWWARSKGRELLWYALAHGEGGFTREQAGADLYPEMDAEAGGRALRNALHELRKLLRAHCGVDQVLVDTGGRLHLTPEELGTSCDTDIRTLEDWLAHLRVGEPHAVGDLPALLTGRYLADLHEDWTRPFRHYWEGEAVRALDLAAAHYERTGRPVEALSCLRCELDFCPDDAILPQRVMVLYHALGDLGGLRATYLSHCRTLRDDLDIDPDPGVVSLYNKLARP